MEIKTDNPSFDELQAAIESRLSPELFTHSIDVSETAGELCSLHCPDYMEQARLAGLIHDIAKPFSEPELLRLAHEFGILITSIEQMHPMLLHASVGAELSRIEYGVQDETVLEAIRWHTVGCAGLHKCGLAVYLADIIEPSRDFDGVELIRERAQKSLIDGALAGVIKTISYVVESKQPLDTRSVEFYNWLISQDGRP